MKKALTRSRVLLEALPSHYLVANFDWARDRWFSSVLFEFQNTLSMCVPVHMCAFPLLFSAYYLPYWLSGNRGIYI